ncbi:MAG: HK97-gp10 family putative phage morphogenesis protein [Alphaproteobacteria bacterium]
MANPIEFKIEVEGLDRLKRAVAATEENLRKELLGALESGARHVQDEAIKSINRGVKTGRLYKVGTVWRRASAPGEPPANQTKALTDRGFRVRLDKEAMSAFVVVMTEGFTNYARLLEFGTSKMAARPFLFPAVESSRAWIEKRLNKAVDRAIKRSGK